MLKFTNTNEALQHLADITGKRIKIAAIKDELYIDEDHGKRMDKSFQKVTVSRSHKIQNEKIKSLLEKGFSSTNKKTYHLKDFEDVLTEEEEDDLYDFAIKFENELKSELKRIEKHLHMKFHPISTSTNDNVFFDKDYDGNPQITFTEARADMRNEKKHSSELQKQIQKMYGITY